MKLTRDMKSFLIMSSVLTIISNYNGIFVNLYVWDQSHSLFNIGWYNLWLFFAASSAYTVATKILMIKSIRTIVQISACSGAVSFLLLLFAHFSNELMGIVIYAVPIGIFLGTYWGGMNIMLSIFGKGKEFELFYSYFAIISQVLSMIVPLLSASVIYLSGFFGSFLLMLLFIVIMFITSFYIPDFSLRQTYEYMSLKGIIRLVKFDEIKSFLPVSFFHAILVTFQNLFVLLFTFQVTENEWLIAVLNILYSLSSIIALKLFNANFHISKNAWLFIGVILMTIGFGSALTNYSVGLVISNICTTFGLFFVNTIVYSGQLASIEKIDVSRKVALLLYREWTFFFMRYLVLGIVLFIDGRVSLFYGLIILVAISSFVIPMKYNDAPIHKANTNEFE
jgi:MFS transporter, YQGE family, putative transporter